MEGELVLTYLNEEEIEQPEYISFFEKYHGAGSFGTWGKKIHWYFSSGCYRLLVARLGRDYVGQSTAYMAKAMVLGEEKDIWWGADAFVLEEMRGKRIGKRLQQKLHEDLPNFSSAAYAALNGLIKRRCGAREIKSIPYYYYPVSCYLTMMLELTVRKLTRNAVRLPRLRLPSVYLGINSPSRASRRQTVVREIPREEIPGLSAFMEECLRDEDFHVVRSRQFLQWKYTDNPLISFTALSVERDGKRVGIVILSDTYRGHYLVTQARLAKVYDCVASRESGATREQVLKLALAYMRTKWQEAPDGVLSVQHIPYCPRITYPAGRAFLSTLQAGEIGSCYLSYIDQDMERMG